MRWIDKVIMWLVHVVWSIPTLLMVIAISLALGKGFWQVFVAVGLSMWVEVARVVRGQVLSLKQKEYIQAARSSRFGDFRIMFRHLLPNVVEPYCSYFCSKFCLCHTHRSWVEFFRYWSSGTHPFLGSHGKKSLHLYHFGQSLFGTCSRPCYYVFSICSDVAGEYVERKI